MTVELPRGYAGAEEFPLSATAHWMDEQDVLEHLRFRQGMIYLGTLQDKLIGVRPRSHLITFAGSRAGKGISVILPNLLLYSGSIIAIDPKAELATITAARRGRGTSLVQGMNQEVHLLDPYGEAQNNAPEYWATYNPMDRIRADDENGADDAGLIADSLIISTGNGDNHWTTSARHLIKALILVLALTLPPGHQMRNLIGMRRLLMDVDLFAKLERFVRTEPTSHVWVIARQLVAAFVITPEEERGSILSTARTQTEFLDSQAMAKVLSSSSFSFDDVKRKPTTIYLSLPAMRFATHGRWLRLMINCALEAMERTRKQPKDPVLFLMDEFFSLGRMERIEKAAGLMAGYGVKLWPILQDLQQLQSNYRSTWQTFIGNASVLQSFGNTDPATSEFLARRLGKVTIATASQQKVSMMQQLTGQSGINASRINTELLQPDEIERYFAAHNWNQLIKLAGHAPIQLDRAAYYKHAEFVGKYERDPAYR